MLGAGCVEALAWPYRDSRRKGDLEGSILSPRPLRQLCSIQTKGGVE